MASDVLSALDLDKETLNEKFILVKELAGSDANFLINCLISKQVKDNNGLVLVAVHNPFKYYQKSGLSMGYNLTNCCQDVFKCIDCFELINTHDKDKFSVTVDLISKHKSLVPLFQLLEKDLNLMLQKHKSVCLIIDDLLDFIQLGFNIEDINDFVQCCRGYMFEHKNLSMALGIHVIPEDDESCVLAGLMSHMSDMICEVSSLKTGRSFDISGSFTIKKPFEDLSKTSSNLMKLNKYHYKIFERGIKVFAPGSK